MTRYISKMGEATYAVLDANGDRMGILWRANARRLWEFRHVNTPNSEQYLARDLKLALEMLEPEAKWLEQITAFAELQ